jgi:hypothetical protein
MSVYISCKVEIGGSDEVVEAFLSQLKSEIPSDLMTEDESGVLFIGGRNYDASHDVVSIAECFDGLPLTVSLTVRPEQQEFITEISVECMTGAVTSKSIPTDVSELLGVTFEEELAAKGLILVQSVAGDYDVIAAYEHETK